MEGNRIVVYQDLQNWFTINTKQRDRIYSTLRTVRCQIYEQWFYLITMKPEAILLDSIKGRSCVENHERFAVLDGPKSTVLGIPK